jgi:replicative DNA helicase
MSDSANKNNFIYAPWFRTVTIPRTTFEQFRAVKNDFKMIFGEDNLIVESYPVGTFSCMDLEKRLKLLEEESGFVADIVLVDYPNVMKMNDKKDLRLAIGDIWKGLASIKQSRNCLVVAASQTNRAAISKADLTMEDLAEDFSKAMISDVFLAINQTPTEKDDKVARISTILHRHRDFSLHKQCRILQVPELGQFCISSHPVSRKL